MKNRLLKLLFIGIGLLFLSQCTKEAVDENNHPEGWADAGSENFHGINVKSSGSSGCFTCHGDDNNGGNTGISCYDCHTGGPSGHPDSTVWLNPQNDNFHGNSVAVSGPVICADCHGTDYTGGLSGQDCYTCHAGGPSGHPADSIWVESPENSEFHGAQVASNGPSICSDCHGDDYLGGTSLQSCYTCHAGGPSGHPASSIWVGDQTSDSFHGNVIIANGWDDCTTCHGDDYLGGTSEQSCYSCHAGGRSGHPGNEEWLDQSSDNYHGKIFWENGWDFTDCQSCHGSNYDGGVAEVACGSCHTGTTTELFTCTTCHGGNNNINPPKGIMGQTATSSLAVGAHDAHLNGGTYSDVIQCNECHNVPETWDADGHLGDDNRAEVVFGTLATGGGTVEPAYNASTGTCSNVYCHGAFSYTSGSNTIVGNNADVKWNSQSGISCGSCHSLPPEGHTGTWTRNQCFMCHSSVMDNEGNIKDKTLHINGKSN